MKSMTLRLPDEMATELAAVARADEMPVSNAVRQAIARHIAERRKDKDFKARLRKITERDREVLERLAR